MHCHHAVQKPLKYLPTLDECGFQVCLINWTMGCRYDKEKSWALLHFRTATSAMFFLRLSYLSDYFVLLLIFCVPYFDNG